MLILARWFAGDDLASEPIGKLEKPAQQFFTEYIFF